MKKTLTALLLSLLIFSIIGWQWMFFIKLYSHQSKQRHARSGRDREEIIVLRKSDPKTFLLNDHELMYNGKLYDIKHREKVGNDLLCRCEYDGDEENLFAAFDLKTKDASGNSVSQNPKSLKIVKLSVFENANAFEIKSHSSRDIVFCENPFPHLLSSTVNAFFVPPDAS